MTNKSILVISDESFNSKFSAKGIRARREVEILKKIYKKVRVVIVYGRESTNESNISQDNVRIYNSKFAWLFPKIIAKKILSKHKNFDYIFSINLNNSIIGFYLSKISGKKFIVDYHGVVPEERKYLGSSKFIYKYFKRIEKKVLNEAFLIIVVSGNMKKHITQMNILEEKLRVVPNCVESWFLDTFQNVINTRENIRKKYNLKDKFVIGYCGSASKWQLVPKMMELFSKIQKNSSLDLHLFVITGERIKFEKWIDLYNLLDKVTITSAKHSEIPKILPSLDLGLLIRDDSIVNHVAAPTKTGEYLACGVPLLTTYKIGNVADLNNKSLNNVFLQISLEIDKEINAINNYINKISINRIEYIESALILTKKELLWEKYTENYNFQ